MISEQPNQEYPMMSDCPEDSSADYQAIANAIMSGNSLMINNRQINALLELLREEDTGYNYAGLRIVAKGYDGYDAQPGDALANSHVWEDGNYTEEELNGTCAIDINARKLQDVSYFGYLGDRVYLIAGDSREHGEDEGEIIIRDAIVLRRLI